MRKQINTFKDLKEALNDLTDEQLQKPLLIREFSSKTWSVSGSLYVGQLQEEVEHLPEGIEIVVLEIF